MNILKILLLYIVTASAALASPGAHGPNGEHLDAPGGQVFGDAGPRIETFTEAFELVGHLQEDELSVLVDRYDSNEPVLNGKLEVEFNGLTAPAKFHADHGDYAIDDKKFLQALAKPGKHALVFTLTAGDESDLLEGTLEVKAADNGHGHSQGAELGRIFSLSTWAMIGALLAIVFTAIAIALIRREKTTGK